MQAVLSITIQTLPKQKGWFYKDGLVGNPDNNREVNWSRPGSLQLFRGFGFSTSPLAPLLAGEGIGHRFKYLNPSFDKLGTGYLSWQERGV